MKYLYLIIFSLMYNSCVNTSIKNIKNDNKIVKYYLELMAYNNTSFNYKPKVSYYHEAPKDFNFETAVKECMDVEWTITKVVYDNQNNIPSKVMTYCGDIDKPLSSKIYDKEGKIIEEIPLNHPKIIYSYKKNGDTYEKDKTTLSWITKKPLLSRYIYDKNMKLIKLLKYEDGKQYAIYKFDKNNKNILIEYNMKGKKTGKHLLIDEFLDE